MKNRIAGILAVLVLAACQSSNPGTSQTPIGSAVPTAWNVATWKPSTPYTAPVVTEAELMKRRAASLKGIAEAAGLNHTPPDPGLVRWIMTNESGRIHVECLRSKGWNNMTPNPDGAGMSGDLPPDSQKQAYGVAWWQCYAMYTPDERFAGTPTPALLGFMWEYWHDYLIPCLRSHGVKETEPLPSKEQYIAMQGRWNGYPIREATDAIQRACPQSPPMPPM